MTDGNKIIAGALAVGRYAEVLAHTVYFGVAYKAEILLRLGVDPAEWAAADARWTQALVDEALEDEHPVTGEFSGCFAPVLKRLKLEKPSIASIGSSPPSPQQTALSVARPFDAPAVTEPPIAKQQPTYLAAGRGALSAIVPVNIADSSATAPTDHTTEHVGTEEVDLRAFRAALPFLRGPTLAVEAVPPAHSEEGSEDETMKLSVIDLLEPKESIAADATTTDDSGDRTLPPRSDVGGRHALPFLDPSHCDRPWPAQVRASAPLKVAPPPAASPAIDAPDLSLDDYARFRARLSVEGSASPASIPGTRASAHLAATAAVDTGALVSALAGNYLPFVEGRSSLKSEEVRPARGPTSVGSGTVEADLSAMLASVDSARGPVEPVAPESAPPRPRRPPAFLAGTVVADLGAAAGGSQAAPLPFEAPTRASPTAPEASVAPIRRKATVGSGTVEGDLSAMAAQSNVLPASFAQAAGDGAKMSLEVYAGISGAIARGEPRDAVLSRHNMTEPQFEQQARAWGLRFQKEPELVERFRGLVRRGP